MGKSCRMYGELLLCACFKQFERNKIEDILKELSGKKMTKKGNGLLEG